MVAVDAGEPISVPPERLAKRRQLRTTGWRRSDSWCRTSARTREWPRQEWRRAKRRRPAMSVSEALGTWRTRLLSALPRGSHRLLPSGRRGAYVKPCARTVALKTWGVLDSPCLLNAFGPPIGGICCHGVFAPSARADSETPDLSVPPRPVTAFRFLRPDDGSPRENLRAITTLIDPPWSSKRSLARPRFARPEAEAAHATLAWRGIRRVAVFAPGWLTPPVTR